MNIYIRADASTEIGSGHVMRCLTLAEALQSFGWKVTFICRRLNGDLCEFIEQKGMKVHKLAWTDGASWEADVEQTKCYLMKERKPINLLIIDHYSLDIRYESSFRNIVQKIMVIDDLANREHDCDILLDQNLYLDKESRYDDLIPSHCKTFLGPKFILLNKQFKRIKRRKRDGQVKRLNICFGGSDLSNETRKTIEAFLLLNRSDIEVDVVVGMNHPFKEEIQKLCQHYHFLHFYCQIDHMATVLNEADLAVGAGGATTWERCYVGLPSIVISIAENQKIIAETLGKLNVTTYLGSCEAVGKELICHTLERLLNNAQELVHMSQSSIKLVETNHDIIQHIVHEITFE